MDKLFSQSAIAKELSIDRRTVANRLEHVTPFKTERNAKLYRLGDIVSAFSVETDDLNLTAERARLAKEQADKTEMENSQKRGHSADVRMITERWAAVGSHIKLRMLAIAAKAAPLIVGEPDMQVIKHTLEILILESLSELAGTPPGVN